MSGPDPEAYFEIRNDLADGLLKGSHQLAGVPETDRATVLRAALDAVPEASAMLRPFPVLFADGGSSASRLAFSCLSAAATFPRATRGRLAELGALTTILFGVDDIADSIAGQWSEREVAAFFAQFPAILSGTAEADPSGEPVGQVLAAWTLWCARFHTYAGAAVHSPNLARQMEIAFTAMAHERAWTTGVEPWPSYDGYLANGMLTILYHTWWAAALAMCGPSPAVAAHWPMIEPMTHLGASSLRLANDIRSFEREKSEGKPNSISILQASGVGAAAAVRRVAAHIDEINAAFRGEVAQVGGELAEIAEGQLRSVSFNGRWYMARDTHAYTVQELAGEADLHQG
ncbi:terpene synthase family protein [Nonomuraea roseola]|uniref:Terpene synthase family protein n=1 Tax=Nonomuraea roseola TaxID=46179 RepID=A0ABV5Q3T6_9ACTN